MIDRQPTLPLYRAIGVWLMIAQFLLQPLLAYWVTPRVTGDGHGRWVVMCTLNGTRTRYVDFGSALDSIRAPDSQPDATSAPGQSADPENDYCPALKLYQLAGSAQIAQPPQAPPAMAYLVGLIDQSASHQHHVSLTPGYSSRAPPIV